MPHTRSRDPRRYDIESLAEIMADLETYLQSADQQSDRTALDEWHAHILYNLAAKLVELQTVQRAITELLRDMSEELQKRATKEKGRRRRG